MKILIAILLFLAVMSCNEKQQNTGSQNVEAKADSVTSFTAKRDSVQKTISLSGDLFPDENIQIRAKVTRLHKKD